MPKLTIQPDIQVAGVTIKPPPIEREGNTLTVFEGAVNAAATGILTQRSDNTTGEIQMASGGHGISTSDVVDVYWSGGVQYGCTVGTVTGITVPVSGGAGDNLPSTSTAVTVCRVAEYDVFLDGDMANFVAVLMHDENTGGTGAGLVRFTRLSGTLVKALDVVINQPQAYDLAAGVANPFTGAFIYKLKASQAATAAAVLQLLAVIDN